MQRSCTTLGLALVFALAAVAAQVPGPNVNMVSGVGWPGGDPFLQRQNEPSIAVSTRNPLHLLAGANDYRTVDLPGLPDDKVVGDAWLGVFKSFDGGQTWRSTLVPGYPQDASPLGQASPLHGFEAGADPIVRAGTNGLFFYGGLAFNRGVDNSASARRKAGTTASTRLKGNLRLAGAESGASAVFVSRFIDNNNKENGDPIAFVDTVIIDHDLGGPGGRFLDKPWFLLDAPGRGAATCTINVPQENGQTLVQSFPGGNAYVVYSAFTGSGADLRGRIMFARSLDCGTTWSRPKELSKGHQTNQGATMAIDPRTGTLYVAWRRFKTTTQADAYLVTRSVDGGRKFGKPIEISPVTPFDQGTTPVSFRSNAYPTMAVDHAGRIYLAWSSRGVGPEGDARIVLSTARGGFDEDDDIEEDHDHKDDDQGKDAEKENERKEQRRFTFSASRPIDNPPTRGHQITPALSFVSGKLMIAYYDLRDDSTFGCLNCPSRVLTPDGPLVPTGDLVAPPGHPENVFNNVIADTFAHPNTAPLLRRHTIDLRAAQADPGPQPMFHSTRVAQYRFGSRPGSSNVEQFQFNPPDLPLFAQGTRPFAGDYVDLSGLTFVPTARGRWRFNTSRSNAAVFHAAWTDNRDVRPPKDGNWAHYTPPRPFMSSGPSSSAPSLFDPNQARPACEDGQAGMRNQNIYTSRITEGLYVSSPGNAKPLGAIQRGFVVNVQNATDTARSYRLRILRQPPGGSASFLQFAFLDQLDVTIARRSSISRTVFVTSSDPHARVPVDVAEIAGPGAPAPLPGGLQSSVVLNPDITNPDITNPDITNPAVQNPDITNAEVFNPDITNPDITNPDITNPDITNPDITNPDITNVNTANPDITNPDITNPDITNPDITNPDITNPDITNPDITNGAITDATWTVSNNGNTAAAYSVKLLLNGTVPQGFKLQLILHKIYKTPVAQGCDLKVQTQNVLIANIRNPVFTDTANLGNSDLTNPDITNATLSLAPGETARITLRVLDPNRSDEITFDPAAAVTPVIVAQAVNTADAAEGITQPPIAIAPLSISTSSLPGGTVGVAYNQTLSATGGIGTRSWSLPSGPESLPPGLTLSSAGVISGTPTAAGTFPFIVEVQDFAVPPHTATRSLSITVKSAVAAGDLVVANGPPGASGGTLLKIAPDGSSASVIASISGCPEAIAVKAGDFYVADPCSSPVRILKVTPSGSVSTFFGNFESPLVNPIALAVDSAGNVIVGDNSVDKLFKIAADGTSISVFKALPNPSVGTLQDIHLALDSSGNIIAAYDDVGGVSGQSAILRITPDGGITTVFSGGSIKGTGGLAIDSSGDYIVTDYPNNRVVKVTSSGTGMGTVTEIVKDTALCCNLVGLAIDTAGNFFATVNAVAGSGGPRVVRITPPGETSPTITTVLSGSPLTFPNAVLVYP